jgi:hypothetical protein
MGCNCYMRFHSIRIISSFYDLFLIDLHFIKSVGLFSFAYGIFFLIFPHMNLIRINTLITPAFY